MNLAMAQRVVAVAGLVVGTETVAYTALPFEQAAREAPRIVLARYVPKGDQERIAVIEVLKGDPLPGVVVLHRADWLYRSLKPRHLYVILLAKEDRPYVGPLTDDFDPETRVPAMMCGVTNVLEIVDGSVHDFYDYVVEPDGKRLSYEVLKTHLQDER